MLMASAIGSPVPPPTSHLGFELRTAFHFGNVDDELL